MAAAVIVKDLGLIDYKEAWDYQEELFKKTVDLKIAIRNHQSSEATKNYLLICEHPHVYTLGKSGDPRHLLLTDELLHKVKATFYKINRGGDITYHGPGQLVVYPILDLDTYFFSDIHKYMRFLEETVIQVLAEYGLQAGRIEGLTGVWMWDKGHKNERKICAMGVKSSRWVTMHGIGFNVNTDLNYFNHIVPCGIEDKSVTSLQKELGHSVDMDEVKEKFKKHFTTIFNAKFSYEKIKI
ncbi:MAG: lipoyl(octanoyl) transferase LipB [Brumimicrobium sp.]|nr:lipoyl(octanoyl) transferase LipB [Brumimicrobium sp.]